MYARLLSLCWEEEDPRRPNLKLGMVEWLVKTVKAKFWMKAVGLHPVGRFRWPAVFRMLDGQDSNTTPVLC